MLFFQQPALILTGVPASLTIMSILGIHELSHYFMARRHGLETSLPYFIPVPFGFGTFGGHHSHPHALAEPQGAL